MDTSARPEVRGTADVGYRSLFPILLNPPRTHSRLYHQNLISWGSAILNLHRQYITLYSFDCTTKNGCNDASFITRKHSRLVFIFDWIMSQGYKYSFSFEINTSYFKLGNRKKKEHN